MSNHGLALNKNTFSFSLRIVFKQDPTDGLILDSQEAKDLIIAQLEAMSILEEQLLMPIISVVCMLE